MVREALNCALLICAIGVAACSPRAAPRATADALPAAVRPPPAALPPAPVPMHEGGIAAALAEARRDHKPVFVDLWATWCPPCMAMRAWAFEAPELRALGDKFIWLSIDRDGPEGDDAAKLVDLHGLPTIVVLDPDTGAPLARWGGALSGPDLARFLSVAGQSPLPEGAAEALGPTRPLSHDDDEGHAARARAEEALRKLPPSSPLAPLLVSALVTSARDHHDLEGCARLAEEWTDRLPDSGLTLDVALAARGCALEAKPANPSIATHQLARAGSIVERSDSQVLGFSRGYSALLVKMFRTDAGDAAGADRVAASWWRYVHDEWSRSNAIQRASLAQPAELWFDRTKNFDEATKLRADIAHESPADVEALRRWGEALQMAGRFDQGADAIEHGLPAIAPDNRLPAIWEEAELLDKKGDKAREAAVLEAALRLPQPSHISPRLKGLRDDAEKRLSELHAH